MIVHGLYFTGTGNALDACRTVLSTLEEAGYETSIEEMVAGSGTVTLPRCDWLVITFPVYAWRPPRIVRRFLNRLQLSETGEERKPVKVLVIAVDGGDGMRAASDGRRLLTRKLGGRIDVRVADRVQYPINWTQFIPPDPVDTALREISEGRERVRVLTRDAVAGSTHYYRPQVFSMVISRLVGLLFGWLGRGMLSQFFIANDRCTSCRICEKRCPVGAIHMIPIGSDAPRPRWRTSCESCNRCINICPEKAIVTSWGRIGLSFAFIGLLIWSMWPLGTFVSALSDRGAVHVIVYTLVVVGAHAVGIPLLPVFFNLLERIPGVGRFMKRGFNASWRRYEIRKVMK